MKYRFSFDRKRLVVLMVGVVLVAILAFACGVVTGVGLWMPAQAEIALLKKGSGGAASASSAIKVPAKPELPKVAVPVPEKPALAAHAERESPAPAAAPAAPGVVPEPSAQPSAQPGAQASALPPSPADDVFALQLGSFLKPENAKQLQAELKDKGYTATIFRSTDADQRTWHTVRIGGFKTLPAAAHAAADFSAKERIQALVRRSDAL